MVSSSGGLSLRRAASAVAPVLLAIVAVAISRAAPAQQPADIRLSRYERGITVIVLILAVAVVTGVLVALFR